MNTAIIGEGSDAYKINRKTHSRTTRQKRIKEKANLKMQNSSKTRSMIHTNVEFFSDNSYCAHFWGMIMKDPLISSIEGIENCITEEDASSLRNLYAKLKSVFGNNPEEAFGISDQDTRDIHYLLDRTYETLLGDNEVTDKIFLEAKKKFEGPSLKFTELEKDQAKLEQPIFRFRPYNMEPKLYSHIVHNTSVLSTINPYDCPLEEIREIIEANRQFSDYIAEKYGNIISRKGRPRKNEYISEAMFTVESLNDLIPIVQNQAGILRPAQQERISIKKLAPSKNKPKLASKGTIGQKSGKLMNGEACPVSYHPSGMGYTTSVPRGKWKCYFCKVIKYGIRANLTKIAPNEKQYCKILVKGTDSEYWQSKADVLLNIILFSYPATKIFWAQEKRESKQYTAKNTYPMDLTKIKK